MAKDQRHYYDHKKPWSRVKDDLLGVYLAAYFQKVLTTGKPIHYIDCFAGRGEFLDGDPGSPVIALHQAEMCLNQARPGHQGISMTFIEAQHGADLDVIVAKAANAQVTPVPTRVVCGRFEQEACPAVAASAGQNVFLYIDPYGIKDLQFDRLTGFGNRSLRLNSVELLMNFNSFGFIRAACRAMKVAYEEDPDLVVDDEEFADSFDKAAEPPSVALLDSIAGGTNWRAIVGAIAGGQINGLTAERQFSDMYRDKLRETYRYVLSMPIRVARHRHPKYRMIHATNHPQGCVLMAEDMMKRTEDLYIHIAAYKQASLFDEDAEGDVTDAQRIEDVVRSLALSLRHWTDVEEVLAGFYSSAGVICRSGEVTAVLRRMEQERLIDVDRHPETTKTGQASTFFRAPRGGWVRIRATDRRKGKPDE